MQNNPQLQIAGAIIIAGVLIAGAILLKDARPASNTGNNINNPNELPSGDIEVARDEHILGNPDADIYIIEYSDLECPFCKVFHETMHQVVNSNQNVAWVYRHYPIPALHAKAFKEAEATECAWEQGGNDAFWSYTDKVFEITTSNDGLDEAELPKIAQSLGLDVNQFNECLASGKYQSKVQASIEGGVELGVNGTPSSFIVVDGKVVDQIPGAQPFDVITERLKEI
jgi:protein-disulfide isomerase